MDNITQLPPDDIRLVFATNMSKLNLKAFIYRFQNRDKGEEFLVKTGLTEGNVIEHLWVEVSEYYDDRKAFTGKIANHPRELKKVKINSRVGVSTDDINDLYIKKGMEYEGAFLAAAFNNREPIPITDKRSFLQKIGLKK